MCKWAGALSECEKWRLQKWFEWNKIKEKPAVMTELLLIVNRKIVAWGVKGPHEWDTYLHTLPSSSSSLWHLCKYVCQCVWVFMSTVIWIHVGIQSTVRSDDTAHMWILLCLCANISSQINCKIFQEINFVDYTHRFGVRISRENGACTHILVCMYIVACVILEFIKLKYLNSRIRRLRCGRNSR